MIDISICYGKLAKGEQFSEDEIVTLLKELEHFRTGAAYLASCQAATVESLPKSTSKSALNRHLSICESAAKILDGDRSAVRYPSSLEVARDRCVAVMGRR